MSEPMMPAPESERAAEATRSTQGAVSPAEEYRAGGELVRADDAILMPVDPESARRAMDAYQATTAAILQPSDWQGAAGRPGSFVKKSGWRKISKAYRLSAEIRAVHVERDSEGQPTKAHAVVRAVHVPSGQFQDGDGYCDVSEPRFADARGRLKLENDLRATATTRAKNRAIADLVGMGAVSSEEADTSLAAGPQMRNVDPVYQAVVMFLGEDGASEMLQWVIDQHGYLPSPVGRALIKLARIEAEQNQPPPEAEPVSGEVMPDDPDDVDELDEPDGEPAPSPLDPTPEELAEAEAWEAEQAAEAAAREDE